MHFATSGFIVNQDCTKVLMVFHKKLQTWVIPGGHLEPNEYPAEGARREIFEETGVEATILNSALVALDRNCAKESEIPTPYVMLSEYIPGKGDKKAHIHMDFVFIGKADESQSLAKQEAEVNDVKWMDFEEVMSCKTFGSVKQIAERVLNRGGVQECVSLDL